MKPPTSSERKQLESETFALILRHGWKPFMEVTEKFCKVAVLHGRLTDRIWRYRARHVRNASGVPRTKLKSLNLGDDLWHG